MKGWKTLTFNLISAVFGVLGGADFVNLVPPQYQGYVISGVALVNMLLRMNTNTPIGKNN